VSLSALTRSPYDRELVAHVQPPDWVNPRPLARYHLVVLGAGTAGLVTAAGAAGLGAKVALVERSLMGGDCLNVGCVPSKAVIASASAAAAMRRAGEFGVGSVGGIAVDFPAVMERMRRLRAGIASHDGARRFTDLGIDVFLGEARFASPTEVEVGGQTLRFARAVVATGGRATVPPIPGLAAAGFRTNETIFNLTELPRRLAVVGGGPIGCELAQAFSRLGSQVTIVQKHTQFLPREDREAAELLLRTFLEEKIGVRLDAKVEHIELRDGEKLLQVTRNGSREILVVDEILLAAGRQPNIEGLGLEAAGVAFTKRGVTVDDHLRTTNRRVYAAGDVALDHKFTHLADATARIVIQNALFPVQRKASGLTLPWCTYTDPEIAHVGLSPDQARERGLSAEEVTVPFSEVDRARLTGETDGFARLLVETKKGRILGATIAGAQAGELISEVSVAMAGGVTLGALAGVIHPYPTLAEVLRKAGDAWNRRRLTPRFKKLLVGYLSLRFGNVTAGADSSHPAGTARRGDRTGD
jgi:pyruvate/2-oxoglutarate dehydrogenase complex dihydrolipoamide dehydrogenase (E3) component